MPIIRIPLIINASGTVGRWTLAAGRRWRGDRRLGRQPGSARLGAWDRLRPRLRVVRLRGEVVFVDQAAEPVVTADPIERDDVRLAFVIGIRALLG